MDFNLLLGWICSLFLLTELVISLSWLYDWCFCYQSFSFEIHLYVQAIYDLDTASDIFLLIRGILVVFCVYFTLWKWMIHMQDFEISRILIIFSYWELDHWWLVLWMVFNTVNGTYANFPGWYYACNHFEYPFVV